MYQRKPENLIDLYKADHRRQYPPGTTRIQSNWTPRGSRIPGVTEVVFFGLQYFLQNYLVDMWGENFFAANRGKVEQRYTEAMNRVFGANTIGSYHIGELHERGHLPLLFSALPEGTRCPLRVPMLIIDNTDDKFFWLVNYIESVMSNILWMPCTSATIAVRYRELMEKYAEETGVDKKLIPFMGCDFSFRGMAGVEAAEMSGAAHLLSFVGSDTLPAIDWIDYFYPGNNGYIGGSVMANEHSVTMTGGAESEIETIKHMLNLYPSGIVSYVSDTWNLWDVLTQYLPQVKDLIVNRNGVWVTRPDSGDPPNILCGDANATDERARKGVTQLLAEFLGTVLNSKGYKKLHPNVSSIYGDGISYDRLKTILGRFKDNGFESPSSVFGFGSFSYQPNTRDTFGFAMKSTHAVVNGESRDLFKKPITDTGEKHSARGRLAVHEVNGKLTLIERATPDQEARSLLTPVWRNGEFLRKQSFADVRNTLWPANGVHA